MTLITLVFGAFLAGASGAKILAYFPFPGKSHHFAFQPILHELGRRGHRVDYYSPFKMNEPQGNVTVIPIGNCLQRLIDGISDFPLEEQDSQPVHKTLSMLNRVEQDLTDWACENPQILNLIHSNDTHYDLVLHGSYCIQAHSTIFKHKFNVTGVVILPMGDFLNANEVSGLVNNPAYVVHYTLPYSDEMTFFERLHNTYATALVIFNYYYNVYRLQSKIDLCFNYTGSESRPSLFDLISDESLILITSHHAMGYSYPLPPNAKTIGPTVLGRNHPLPPDLEKFIDEAKHGVIYFSLGTMFDLNTLPQIRDAIASVFAQRPEKVLWKWNHEPWDNVPANVKLSKWLPQKDILVHRNVKVFVSHAGLQSSYEAMNYGVPVVALPVFADQLKNARRIQNSGFGLGMPLKDVTEKIFSDLLTDVIENPKYKQTAVKRSAFLRDQPMSPVDTGAYWIEYVLRHGNILQSQGARLTFIQRHNWDVIGFVTACLCIAYLVVKKLLVYLLGLIGVVRSRRSPGKEKAQ